MRSSNNSVSDRDYIQSGEERAVEVYIIICIGEILDPRRRQLDPSLLTREGNTQPDHLWTERWTAESVGNLQDRLDALCLMPASLSFPAAGENGGEDFDIDAWPSIE